MGFSVGDSVAISPNWPSLRSEHQTPPANVGTVVFSVFSVGGLQCAVTMALDGYNYGAVPTVYVTAASAGNAPESVEDITCTIDSVPTKQIRRAVFMQEQPAQKFANSSTAGEEKTANAKIHWDGTLQVEVTGNALTFYRPGKVFSIAVSMGTAGSLAGPAKVLTAQIVVDWDSAEKPYILVTYTGHGELTIA